MHFAKGAFRNSKPFWVVVKILVPIRVILGLYWGCMGNNGKGNGNYCSILGLYLGGCQNYGPFLDPFHNTAPILLSRVPKNGPYF